MPIRSQHTAPTFKSMRSEVNLRADILAAEVAKALPGGEQQGPSDDTTLSLNLLDAVAERMTPENVVYAKSVLRFSLWATKVALKQGPDQGLTPAVREALEDSRGTTFDISWVKEARKIPSKRFESYIRPCASDIPNYERVNANFLRGGQPDQGGADWLKENGVKTILDLRGGDRENQCVNVDYTGLDRKEIDVPDFHPPSFEQLDEAIEILDNPENHPVFLHCKAGVGRTGTVTACWRIAHGATADEALAAERINSYHGSLKQEQFVRDFEKRLKSQSGKMKDRQGPHEPDRKFHVGDPWPLTYAYTDIMQGKSTEAIIEERGLNRSETRDLLLFQDFWQS